MRVAVSCLDGDDAAGELEGVLMDCLEACETWNGHGVTDGLVAHKTVIVDNTVEVRGQMSAFKGKRGFSVEPFEAIITLDETRTLVESAVIRYGDAERGIGAVEQGEPPINPRSVTFWLYELHTGASAVTTGSAR